MKGADGSEFQEGDIYYTPEGFIVFTEQYLLRRGYCCESGCRHCPYGYNKKKLKDEDQQKGEHES